ncbi:hypothetical protein D3C75_1317290 [compost metagenome]
MIYADLEFAPRLLSCATPNRTGLRRHKAILTAIENRDALGARHATLVQLDDARSALNVVLGSELS